MNRLRSLYVCYLSLEDPLVESQVVAYLEGLAERGHLIHLLTFETRRLTRARRRALGERMRARGIAWHGLRYHEWPSLPATTFDTLCGAVVSAWLVRRHRLVAIHARSHVPAAMAILAASLAPHRLIFDIRGLWAEEYVDIGRWPANGLAFRITKRVERAGMRRAAAAVVLTERVRALLFGESPREDVFVIPCCADVERITAAVGSRSRSGPPTLVYVGKFGGWYAESEMVAFFQHARAVIPGLRFLVLTQGDKLTIDAAFSDRGIDPATYAVASVAHERLGESLAAAHAAIALIKPLPSKIASSPTKVGECLAAGLPVVTTDVGDTKELFDGTGAGIVLESFSEHAYRSAAEELGALLADPQTPGRCVAIARDKLSLDAVGVPRYDRMYRFVAGNDGCPACGAASRRRLQRFAEAGLVRCGLCGLVYASRRPTDRELAEWYAVYPGEQQISSTTAARLEQLVLPAQPYQPRGTLLDIGAGNGHLLAAAAGAGWGTHGIEYDSDQRERLSEQGHTVHPPLSGSDDLADGSFDVVVMQEVLEHMRAPAAELGEVARVLRPGGLLYVTCPNFGSLSRWALGPGWRVVEYPEHLNYFTPTTLRSLMSRHRFAEVSVTTTGVSIDELLGRRRAPARTDAGAGSVDQRLRASTERSALAGALKHAANGVLGLTRLGDTIKGRYELH